MFGKKKNEVKDYTVNGMSLLDVGTHGTTTDLDQASSMLFDPSNPDAGKLLQGAIQAFNEGRPENVQHILTNPQKFRTYRDYYGNNVDVATQTLTTLVTGKDYAVEILTLALAKVPAEAKQDILNQTLVSHIFNSGKPSETFINTLIEAGADANAPTKDGFKGHVLAFAVEKSKPLPVIELLYKNGASFDDALFLMQVKKWKKESMDNLKVYREKVTGQPATEEGEILKVLKLLREDIAEMTKRLPSEAATPKHAETKPAANANQPETTQPELPKAPQPKKAYPAVKGLSRTGT